MRETMLIYCRENVARLGAVVLAFLLLTVGCYSIPPDQNANVTTIKSMMAAASMAMAVVFLVRFGFMAHGYWVWMRQKGE